MHVFLIIKFRGDSSACTDCTDYCTVLLHYFCAQCTADGSHRQSVLQGPRDGVTVLFMGRDSTRQK